MYDIMSHSLVFSFKCSIIDKCKKNNANKNLIFSHDTHILAHFYHLFIKKTKQLKISYYWYYISTVLKFLKKVKYFQMVFFLKTRSFYIHHKIAYYMVVQEKYQLWRSPSCLKKWLSCTWLTIAVLTMSAGPPP
jgi:hypothetical protein